MTLPGAGPVRSRRRAAPAAVVASTVWADRRLGAHVVLASVGTVAALVTGEVAHLAMAAPAAVLLAWSARHGRAPGVDVVVREPPTRVLEGDRWVLGVQLSWTGSASVDVLHTGTGGHRHLEGAARHVEGDGGARVVLPLEAARWGRHGLGTLHLRARRPGGLLVHDLEVALPGVVRVLPSASRLDALLHPAQPRAAAGAHLARHRGSGTDFAELRPFAPGDRLRDVSWSATARSGEPWVVVHHPERTGTLVLALDGFTEVGVPAGALDRAAGIAWSIARHHLAAGDRVGLLATGPTPRWLTPTAGRRAQWLVLDALLRTDPSVGVRRRPVDTARMELAVPPDALVVGVSSLQSDAFVATMAHHRRLGRPTSVVAVELADLLPAATGEVERAARRLWATEVEGRREALARAGVRTVPAGDDVAGAVRALSGAAHPVPA